MALDLFIETPAYYFYLLYKTLLTQRLSKLKSIQRPNNDKWQLHCHKTMAEPLGAVRWKLLRVPEIRKTRLTQSPFKSHNNSHLEEHTVH